MIEVRLRNRDFLAKARLFVNDWLRVKTILRLFFAVLVAGDFAARGAAPGGESSPTNLAAVVPASALQPFAVEWPVGGQFPADVSFLLRAPAGKEGFIRAQDGRRALPGGARFRTAFNWLPWHL
jgi:hypothetical protein